MRRLVSLLVWWAVLVVFWAAFVGTTATVEILWGLGAAAVAAVAAEVVRSQHIVRLRIDRKWLVKGLKLPALMLFDFGVITWVLVTSLARGRRVSGRYVAVAFPAGATHADHVWRRAYATTLSGMSPNAIPIDIDVDENLGLLHALRPDLSTGRSVL
jgi:hypothetical protein